MKHKENRRLDKFITGIGQVLKGILSVFFLSFLFIGLYITVDSGELYHAASPGVLQSIKPEVISEESLNELSGEAVAWITLENTTVDYAVMQGVNNEEYLSKDPEGNYSATGSVFLDYRNAPDFSDGYNILYGHHMVAGLMFGALDLFAEDDYFWTHRDGTLLTGTKSFALKSAAYLTVNAGCEEIFDPEQETINRDFLAANAAIYDPSVCADQWMALTTCHDYDPMLRTVLIVALTEIC